MKKKTPIASLLKWAAYCLIIIVAVFIVSHYCIGSYRISTEAMNDALRKGEFILVNKMPLGNNPGRNKVVLFHASSDNSAENILLVSRCVGMPGDTIRVNAKGYSVNDAQVPHSPNTLKKYMIPVDSQAAYLQAAERISIPNRGQVLSPEGVTVELTDYEAYQLREELTDNALIPFTQDFEEYTLIVPAKNQVYHLDESTIHLVKDLIIRETKGKAVFTDNKLLINGQELPFFFFSQDYYWMLSDNMEEAVDSRHLGFISANQIIGNALFCWYSPYKNRSLKPVR